MTRRTYRYEVTGTITVDDTDLRSAFLALAVEPENVDPTPEEAAAESMEHLADAQGSAPQSLLETLVRLAVLDLRVRIRPAEHSFPSVRVDEQPG